MVEVQTVGGPGYLLDVYPVQGLTIGASVKDTAGTAWQLTISSATVDHTTVEAVLGCPSLRWVAGGGGGSGTVTSVAATASGMLAVAGTPTIAPTVGMASLAAHRMVGNPTAGALVPRAVTPTELTAEIEAATASLPGAITAALFTKLTNAFGLSRATDLTDADATVQPGQDACSLYVQPASVPLAGSRNLTLGHTGLVTGLFQNVRIVRCDTGVGGLIIKRNDGTPLHTLVALTVAGRFPFIDIYHNATNWAVNTGGFLQAT